MGRHQGADELEYGWTAERRKEQVWRSALLQPARHLPALLAADERLEGWSDAYTAKQLDDLPQPQRGGLLSQNLHRACRLEGTGNLSQLRRSGFLLLSLHQRQIRGILENSRNLAEFNITPYLNKEGKENTVAVEVYRHSDGSFLESQDMFRLPGIFRTVALTAKPQVQVRDFKAIPDLDETYSNATAAYHSSA